MNIIDKIKKLFIKKQVENKNIDTNIALFDISDIYLPSFKNLNEEDKYKVLQYQKEINVNKLEEIIKYNQDISKEGERLSNLLIKYLYELNDVIRKDDKTDEELNEVYINLSIKNTKIIVLRDKLRELLIESKLRAIAIDEITKRELKKKYEFLGIFSRASKLKRNMELKNIDSAMQRTKITIKTLEQQNIAISNAIYSNNTLEDAIDILNTLTSKVENKNIRKKIYYEKLKYFVKVNSLLLSNKLNDISNLEKLLKEDKFNEEKIILIIALIETNIDKYICNNKDIMIPLFKEKLNDLSKNRITIDKQTELLNKISYLEILYETFKEYIDEFDKIRLYQIKFDVLTINILDWNENYLNKTTNREEIKIYKDIISSELQTFYNPEYKEEYRTVIKLILEKFRTDLIEVSDNKDVEKKIFNSYLMLSFILLVNYPGRYQKYINDCLYHNHYIIHLNFPNYYFDFENEYQHDLVAYIDDNRFNILKDYYTLVIIRKILEWGRSDNKEWVNEIWLSQEIFCKKTNLAGINSIINSAIFLSYLFNKIKSQKMIYLKNDTLYFREGITMIDSLYKSLSISLKNSVKRISFPKSILYMPSLHLSEFKKLKEIIFQDYKESKLLYSLLYKEDSFLIYTFFERTYSKDCQPYIHPVIDKIVLCDKNYCKIELTREELEMASNIDGTNFDHYDAKKIQKNLSKIIEEKTGFDFNKFQEDKILKK